MKPLHSQIYGYLLIAASTAIIAIVINACPYTPIAKCPHNIYFQTQTYQNNKYINTDTFLINQQFNLVNMSSPENLPLQWILSDNAGYQTQDLTYPNITLRYQTEGTKTIQLQLDNNPQCTSIKKQIYILPNCTDNQQNGSETGIDCGGNCPPCNTPPPPKNHPTKTQKPKSKTPQTQTTSYPAHCYDNLQNNNETCINCGGNCPPCPQFPSQININTTNPTCNQPIQFSCQIDDKYYPRWTFDDQQTQIPTAIGSTVTHKFKNKGNYTIRLNTCGQQFTRQIYISDCNTPPPPTLPTNTPTQQPKITIKGNPECNQTITITTDIPSTKHYWLLNGQKYTQNTLTTIFKKTGNYTIQLFTQNNTLTDTRTLQINCQPQYIPSDPLKQRFNQISKKGPKMLNNKRLYNQLLNDFNFCQKGQTNVSSPLRNQTLTSYFEEIRKGKYTIESVKIKQPPGQCIQEIYITQQTK